MKAKIIETDTAFPETIIFKVKSEKKLKFLPGQFASIKALSKNRAYSICSNPEDNFLEFCIKGTGEISRHLTNLKVGDEIELEGPYGNFIFKNSKKKNIIFVSTGSGIAPIKSLINQAIKDKSKKILLYFGVKKRENLYYEEHFKSLEKENKNFRFIPVFSREGKKRHVLDVIKEDIKDFNDIESYICGVPIMVKEVKEFFLEKGINESDILTEQY